ncbi:hypothetical protein Lesp02_30530 [Lentzea sp. NBRC 105346]|nr:hypothetical protein Lesp02_30530 [Lentzea sp. NBRC 105346]
MRQADGAAIVQAEVRVENESSTAGGVGDEDVATVASKVTTECQGAAGDHPPKSTVHMPAGHRVGRHIGSPCGPGGQALSRVEGLPL